MLAVTTKRLDSASPPCGRVTKHFWLARDGQPDDLRRDGQKILFEFTEQHDRPFDEAGHFLEQAFILDQIEPVGEGEVPGVGEDDLLAAVGVDDDLGGLQLGRVVIEAAHGDGAGCMKAMAVGDVAGADAADLEIDDHRFLGFGAEGAEDRLQRAHPAQRLAAETGNAGIGLALGAGSGAPAHLLRPGEAAHDAGDQPGDDLFGRPARLGNMGDVEIALLGIAVDMRFIDRGQAGGAQKTLDRLFRRLGARALAFLMHVLRARRQAPQVEHQPARRPVFARRLIGQSGFDQTVSDQFFEVAGSLALHARGNFLAAKLKKQVGHVRSR